MRCGRLVSRNADLAIIFRGKTTNYLVSAASENSAAQLKIPWRGASFSDSRKNETLDDDHADD